MDANSKVENINAIEDLELTKHDEHEIVSIEKDVLISIDGSDTHEIQNIVSTRTTNIEDISEGYVDSIPTIEGTSQAIHDELEQVQQKDDLSSKEGSHKTPTTEQNSLHHDNQGNPDKIPKQEAEGQGSFENGDEEDFVENSKTRIAVNYAHKSAGAIVLEKSSSFKGTSNLLTSDDDKYAISPCSISPRYVVIGLSEDILVKKVVLANFERYSSHIKDFQILGSQAYPVTSKWHDLGTYTAASAGIGKQDFELKEPSWARYLKFKFLTHYGVEHYCTVSQIMVHGSTMLQGFHEQWTQSEKETNDLLRLEEDVVETDNQHEKTERKENVNIVDEHEERNIVNESEINSSDESISHGDQIEKTDKDDKVKMFHLISIQMIQMLLQKMQWMPEENKITCLRKLKMNLN